MKAELFRVTADAGSLLRCARVKARNLATNWHFHPEYQLTVVTRGRGHRLVGDDYAPLAPGDLTLLGPNLPHFWSLDGDRAAPPEAVIVQFRADFLGTGFFSRPEWAPVDRLLSRSARGLAFAGRASRPIGARLAATPETAGADRILDVLWVLVRLAEARGRPLSSPNFVPALNDGDQTRLEAVCRHVQAHLGRSISRGELADLAGLSEPAFSRYFRRKMGKTLPRFVNELRVGRACRLLIETDAPVTAVATRCGYDNLSNFNLQFRRIKGVSPREYRKRLVHALEGQPG